MLTSMIYREIMEDFNLNEVDQLAWVIKAADNSLQVIVEKHEADSNE